jgi:hypothetical protein
LVSATIESSTEVLVCFDKPLTNGTYTTDGFWLGGYRSELSVSGTGVTSDPGSADCAFANFGSSAGDIDQDTIFSVGAGAVTDNTTGVTNNSDSTPLTGSTNHAGTAGLTTAPNLVGTLTPSSSDVANNQLEYVFDKNVSKAPAPTVDDFYLEDSGGTSAPVVRWLA